MMTVGDGWLTKEKFQSIKISQEINMIVTSNKQKLIQNSNEIQHSQQ